MWCYLLVLESIMNNFLFVIVFSFFIVYFSGVFFFLFMVFVFVFLWISEFIRNIVL